MKQTSRGLSSIAELLVMYSNIFDGLDIPHSLSCKYFSMRLGDFLDTSLR